MFKSARWRIDRHNNNNRIKSVFRLHCSLSQVPVLVGDALLQVSVIPKDVGKATSRLEKALVKDGCCCWENPVYETVRFVRDPKSGKFNERLYCVVVSTGTQKSKVVGEVLIDFAEYAESIKPSSVSLPFQNPHCAAVLHVTIQRIQEFEDVKVKLDGRSPKTSFGDTKCEERSPKVLGAVEFDEKTASNSVQDTPLARTSSENVETNGNHRVSSGSDLLSSSGCSSELNTPRELAVSIHQGCISPPSSLNFDSLTRKQMTKTLSLPNQELQQHQLEWSVGSDGLSTDDSTINSCDRLQKHTCLSAADVEIEKLKNDFVVLARQADFSSLELQTLRKQIVKESKRGNELTAELISVKEERDALKAECEKLKASRKRMDETKVKDKGIKDPRVLIEELRHELQSERDLNSNLRSQLQKTQDSNAELILAVQDLDEMLEQKNKDMPVLLNKAPSYEIAADTPKFISKCYIQQDEEQKALEELVNRHNDVQDASLLEQKVIDMYHDMEICLRDRDEMEMQMEQLALDYEIIKQENHDMAYKLEQSELQEQLKMQYECSYTSINEFEGQIESLENELRKQEQQYSDSLSKASELQTEVTYLQEELEKQAHEFEASLEAVTRAKIEQEQRAILAEEALRVTKWKNAKTAERLQEDFKRLSMQMASTFDANEKFAMKSVNEAAELQLEKNRIEILFHNTTAELYSVKKDYEAKLDGPSNQVKLDVQHMSEMGIHVDDKTNQLEAQNVREKEMHRGLSQEMLMLRAEIQMLTEVNDVISKERDMLKAELDQANSSIDEAELLLISRNVEISELEYTISLITEKADKAMGELAIANSVLNEKEGYLKSRISELENLNAEYNVLKQTSFQTESENENLRKQVSQLKRDVEKKENALSKVKKKLKEVNGSMTSGTNTELPGAYKEAASLMETIRMLEGQLKLKEISLETMTKSFLEREKDHLDKIRELESRAGESHQNKRCFRVCQVQKVDNDALDTGKVDQAECMDQGQRISKATLNSNLDDLEMLAPTSDQGNLNAVTSEMEKLKEQNISMEMELKELQYRYSEISLKFAEVDGERQKLVMSLRYLKNSIKN